jgi:hypothetical protein
MEHHNKLRKPDPTPEEIAQKMAEIRKRRDREMEDPPKPDDQQANPIDWRPRDPKAV